jgi:CRISPR-associated exonuclease Cas4
MSGLSYDEPELQISGLQHFSFCRRQWALIHIEQQWADNYFTVDGNLMHEAADDPYFTEKRGGLIISRSIPVKSDRLGVSGKCDVVEFRESPHGVPIADRGGKWLPVPVEYKRGKSKEIEADRLQLCAQTICLEEMFCCGKIDEAYIYYGETRRREKVVLSEELRTEVESMLIEMKELFKRGYTPVVKPTKKCVSCSLNDICLPKLHKYASAKDYTSEIWTVSSS